VFKESNHVSFKKGGIIREMGAILQLLSSTWHQLAKDSIRLFFVCVGEWVPEDFPQRPTKRSIASQLPQSPNGDEIRRSKETITLNLTHMKPFIIFDSDFKIEMQRSWRYILISSFPPLKPGRAQLSMKTACL
jgi:hypothetical protein